MYFECFEALRRLSLTGLMVLIQPGTAFQCVMGWLLSVVTLKIVSYCAPFIDETDDTLAEASMWSIMFVFFGALLLRVDVEGDSDHMQDAMGIALVVISVLPVLIGLASVLYSARRVHAADDATSPRSSDHVLFDNPMRSKEARASYYAQRDGIELASQTPPAKPAHRASAAV